MTVPGIGAATSDGAARGVHVREAGVVEIGRRLQGRAGQVEAERAAPGGRGSAAGGAESGGCSTRKAVVVSPARSTG